MSIHYPPGMYSCKVEQQGINTCKDGSKQLVFQIRPVSEISVDVQGIERAKPVANNSVIGFVRLWLGSEKACAIVMRKLRYSGFVGDSFMEFNFVGAQVRCTCKAGDFNGKPQEDWDLVLPPAVQSISQNDAIELDALFGDLLKSNRQPQPPQPQQQTTHQPHQTPAPENTSPESVPF